MPRGLLVLARRRTDPVVAAAATWALAGRTVVLAVLATVAGTRIVANRSVPLVAVYAVAALGPWMLAGLAMGNGRSRPVALTRAGVRVLVVHGLLLAAAVATWTAVQLR